MNNNLQINDDRFDPSYDLQGAAPATKTHLEFVNDAKSLIQTGRLYFNSGRYDEAITHYNEALAIDPKETSVYFYLGVAKFKANKLDEAIADFEKALEFKPWNSLDIYNYTSYIYFKLGIYDKAKQSIKKILTVNHGMINNLLLNATQFFQLMES
jgi:tetratricopeptide (TPR) repeat protein